jgi:hypothetical protein
MTLLIILQDIEEAIIPRIASNWCRLRLLTGMIMGCINDSVTIGGLAIETILDKRGLSTGPGIVQFIRELFIFLTTTLFFAITRFFFLPQMVITIVRPIK